MLPSAETKSSSLSYLSTLPSAEEDYQLQDDHTLYKHDNRRIEVEHDEGETCFILSEN